MIDSLLKLREFEDKCLRYIQIVGPGKSLLDYVDTDNIMIDSAGTAFIKNSEQYNGGGISRAIYKHFGIYMKKHEPFQIKLNTTDAIISNDKRITKHVNLIHAIGPNGKKSPFEDVNNYNDAIKNTIINISEEIKKIDNYKNKTLLLPLISHGIYRNSHVSNQAYAENYIKYIMEFLYQQEIRIFLFVWEQDDIHLYKQLIQQAQSA